MARQLIDAYTEPIELLDSLSDEVREKRAELIALAATGQAIDVPEAPEPRAASDDLMAALEASLTNKRRAKATA